tara:strand:- start:16 stop:213 length:198 start_codon:yes stop_codon:yes gene_type:complete
MLTLDSTLGSINEGLNGSGLGTKLGAFLLHKHKKWIIPKIQETRLYETLYSLHYSKKGKLRPLQN